MQGGKKCQGVVGSGRKGQAVTNGRGLAGRQWQRGGGDVNGREWEVAGSGRSTPVLKLWREARGVGGQGGPKVGFWRPGMARPGFFIKASSYGAVCYC